MVADGEPVYRAGAVLVLAGQAGFDARPIQGGRSTLVDDVARVEPAALVLDSGLGTRPYAADLVAACASRLPDLAIVVVVGRARPVGMLTVLEAGARALVHRWCSPEELSAAVAAALRSQNWVAAPMAGSLHAEMAAEASGQRPPELSRRELEVLRSMSTGATNVAIGRALGISENTVRNHIGSLMGKLGVHNRTDAVATAARAGLVDIVG